MGSSKLQQAPLAFTYDDFILVPQHSKIKSRKDPDLKVSVPNFTYELPIVSAPMNTITGEDMLVTMGLLGAVGVLHRFMPIEEQVKIAQRAIERLKDVVPTKDPFAPVYVAVGANGDAQERVRALLKAGIKRFCIDVANGHNEHCIRAVKDIKSLDPGALVMAGNVATLEGARDLAIAGADSLRIGIGPGSMCTTRQVTGHGLPQLSAVEECAQLKEEYPNVTLIADGGIRKSGDIIKALAIGADVVMVGSLLAGCSETPGRFVEEGDRLYKYYHGMASEDARKSFNRIQVGMVPEGVSKKVPYLGREAKKIIAGLCDSVRVGLSYSGANNLAELREKAVWRRVTGAGYVEGTPHGK